MSETLMLWPDIQEDIPSEIKRRYSDCVDVCNLYRKTNLLGRMVRKILSEHHMSTRYFFEKWYKNLNQYNTIIIHANIINQNVPRVLRHMGYIGRIIYWYWNPVCNCVSPDKIDRDCCELWSFSKEDCKQYNMSYNSTYYFEEYTNDVVKTETDIFFIGADKGRYKKLMQLKCEAEKAGLKTDFRIIRDRSSLENGDYSERLDYLEVIQLIKKSRAVLEILQLDQTGMSLRPMEAIFFGKKLITDNIYVKNEEFYNENSIFIIDDKHNLQETMRKMFSFVRDNNSQISPQYTDYYDFRNWLKRFEVVREVQ